MSDGLSLNLQLSADVPQQEPASVPALQLQASETDAPAVFPVLSLSAYQAVQSGLAFPLAFDWQQPNLCATEASLALGLQAPAPQQYYITETDPFWHAEKGFYYTRHELLTPGLAQVHWDNLIGVPPLSYTETDPVFLQSPAYGISSLMIQSWNLAATWGDHANAGYLKSNQQITLSGEASGTGKTAITVTLDNGAVIGKLLTGYSLQTATALSAGDSILTAFGKLEARINSWSPGTWEPVISASDVTQYWRGDKSWQTLDTSAVPEGTRMYFTGKRVLDTILTGYAGGFNLPISAAMSVVQALGNLQAQVSTKVPGSRTLSINGVSYDLSQDRAWTIATAASWSDLTGKPNSGSFIYNQNSAAQAANFWIDGSGKIVNSAASSFGQFALGGTLGGYLRLIGANDALQAGMYSQSSGLTIFSDAGSMSLYTQGTLKATIGGTYTLDVAGSGRYVGDGSLNSDNLLRLETNGSSSYNVGPTIRIKAYNGGDFGVTATGQGNDGGAGAFRIYDFTAATTRLFIAPSGNVLLGSITDAGYKLDVAGSGRFASSLGVTDQFYLTTGTTSQWEVRTNYWSGWVYNWYRIPGSGPANVYHEFSSMVYGGQTLDVNTRVFRVPRAASTDTGFSTDTYYGGIQFNTTDSRFYGHTNSTGWKKFLMEGDVTAISQPANQIVYGTGSGVGSNGGLKYYSDGVNSDQLRMTWATFGSTYSALGTFIGRNLKLEGSNSQYSLINTGDTGAFIDVGPYGILFGVNKTTTGVTYGSDNMRITTDGKLLVGYTSSQGDYAGQFNGNMLVNGNLRVTYLGGWLRADVYGNVSGVQYFDLTNFTLRLNQACIPFGYNDVYGTMTTSNSFLYDGSHLIVGYTASQGAYALQVNGDSYMGGYVQVGGGYIYGNTTGSKITLHNSVGVRLDWGTQSSVLIDGIGVSMTSPTGVAKLTGDKFLVGYNGSQGAYQLQVKGSAFMQDYVNSTGLILKNNGQTSFVDLVSGTDPYDLRMWSYFGKAIINAYSGSVYVTSHLFSEIQNASFRLRNDKTDIGAIALGVAGNANAYFTGSKIGDGIFINTYTGGDMLFGFGGTHSMALRNNGNLYLNNLNPNDGVTYMATVTNGVLGKQAIPSGGGGAYEYTPTERYDPNGSLGDITWEETGAYGYMKTPSGWKKFALADL